MVIISNYIRYSDILSPDVELYYDKDNTKNKNLLGGILSILSILLVSIAACYFFVNLVLRKNITILNSLKFSAYQNISNVNEIPFMIRIGGSATKPLLDDEKIYFSWMEEWILKEGEETQTSVVYQLDRCTIEHIFPKYRHLFENFTDLNSFKCVNWTRNNRTASLYGINGASKTANNHFDFNFRTCRKEMDKECLPIEDLNKILGSNAFLDVRHLDFEIDHDLEIPQTPIVKQDRLFISNKVFTKVFWNLRVVEYITDFGFIFEGLITDTFFQYDSMRQTMDSRDIESTRIKAFVQFTLQPFPYKSVYNRLYEKAQNVLANVGGIMEFIMFCGFYLNYITSKRLYYSNLSKILSKYGSLHDNFDLNNLKECNIMASNQLTINPQATYNGFIQRSLSRPTKIFVSNTNEVKLCIKHLILPLCRFKYDKNIILYKKYRNKVIELLSVKTMLEKMLDIDELIKLIFDENQKLWFEFYTGKNRILKHEDIQKIVNICKEKSVKDNIDKKIISLFNKTFK